MLKDFKILVENAPMASADALWTVAIDGAVILVSDVVMENVKVYTTSQQLPTGEQRWSVSCMALNYRIDERNRLFIYNT
jgi:hypothetical protein